MSARPTLRVTTPSTANFPNILPSTSELRSAVSLPSAISANTPLSAISRTSAFRDPVPSSALFSAGLPSAGLPSAGPFSATIKLEHDLQKTPITPPLAYLDFLKGISLVSSSPAAPPQMGKSALKRTSTASTTSTASSTDSAGSNDSNASSDSNGSSGLNDEAGDFDKEKGDQIDSAPSTARTDVTCESESECEGQDKNKDKGKARAKGPIPAPIETKRPLPPPPPPATPRSGVAKCPQSAPPAGSTMFPSMKIAASPALSTAGLYSPRSSLSGASPMSRHFDWEAALKSRRLAEATSGSKRPAAPDTPGGAGVAGSEAAASASGTMAARGAVHPPAKRESRAGSSSNSSILHIREVVTRTVTYTPRMGPAPKGKRRKIDSDTVVES